MTTQDQPAPPGANDAVDAARYDTVGGWLLFPAYIYPLCKIAAIAHAVPQLFTALARPGLSLGLQAYILATLASGIVFGVAWIACATFAYALKPFFPRAYIWTSIADIVASAVMIAVAYAAFGSGLTSANATSMMTMIVIAAIAIPYMLMSKRVKETFYKQTPARA